MLKEAEALENLREKPTGKAIDSCICIELKNANIEIAKIAISDLQRLSIRNIPDAIDTSIQGILTKGNEKTANFIRRDKYWLVHTEIPLNAANELFHHPIGRTSVIINGRDNRYEPLKHARPSNKEMANAALSLGREILTDEVMALYQQGIITGGLFISLYRIYTQDGLNLFAETMRKHGLAD